MRLSRAFAPELDKRMQALEKRLSDLNETVLAGERAAETRRTAGWKEMSREIGRQLLRLKARVLTLTPEEFSAERAALKPQIDIVINMKARELAGKAAKKDIEKFLPQYQSLMQARSSM